LRPHTGDHRSGAATERQLRLARRRERTAAATNVVFATHTVVTTTLVADWRDECHLDLA
jgi:hypothetical protein